MLSPDIDGNGESGERDVAELREQLSNISNREFHRLNDRLELITAEIAVREGLNNEIGRRSKEILEEIGDDTEQLEELLSDKPLFYLTPASLTSNKMVEMGYKIKYSKSSEDRQWIANQLEKCSGYDPKWKHQNSYKDYRRAYTKSPDGTDSSLSLSEDDAKVLIGEIEKSLQSEISWSALGKYAKRPGFKDKLERLKAEYDEIKEKIEIVAELEHEKKQAHQAKLEDLRRALSEKMIKNMSD
jgi:hypothetical protein